MKKKVFFSLIFLFLSLVCWFLYEVFTSPIGPPNPPIDTKAECFISKNAFGTYLINCSNTTMAGVLYVAKSNENLDKYIGKKVQIQANYLMNETNSDSIRTNTQCIMDSCQPIFEDSNQTTYAIVIEKVQEIAQ